MSRVPITARWVRSRRRSLVVWVLATSAYAAVNVLTYPSIRGKTELVDAMKDYPEAMLKVFGINNAADLISGPGYLNSQLFALILPLVLVAHAASAAAATVAGEEGDGTLELLASLPVTRRRIVAEKALAVGVTTLLVGLGVTVATAGCAALADMGIPLADLLVACLAATVLALVFGALALALGCATGSRAVALGGSIGIAAVAYLVSSLSSLVTWMEPLRPLSPFARYEVLNPLSGLQGGARDWLVLAGLALALIAAAIATFDHRDLRG